MEVTDVRIRRLGTESCGGSKMRAIVSVSFDNQFVIHDVKLIQGNEKLFIAMPSRKMEDGSFQDIVHPINSEFRDKLQFAILERYRQAISELAEIKGD